MLASIGVSPIITSLLDVDFYKFTMGYVVFKRYKDVPVKYRLTDRKKMKLASIIPVERLREELNHVRTLRFTKSELHYLRGTNEYQERMFSEDYLQFLAMLQLPPYELSVDYENNFVLEFYGKWSEAIYWETIALSIIDELYYEYLMKNRELGPLERDKVIATGVIRLEEKMRNLPTHGITFADFGTRRRFSKRWQWYVLENMKDIPSFVGTSNTRAAMEFDYLPIGTSAHEMYMGVSGIERFKAPPDFRIDCLEDPLRNSHGKTLDDWWETYEFGLSIALTDTYGTDFFFRDFGPERAYNWKGLRHDSGDPFAFGEKVIDFYESHHVDPKTKLIVFSDELNIEKILKLDDRFHGRIKTTYGWGTNLTNDLGFPSLSIVIKLAESNGFGTVKLSDNPEKAMGNPEDVKYFMKVFGYDTRK